MSSDVIGSRMKEFYENRAKTALLRRCYTIIRIDGKAFHSFCRGLKKPFDDGLMEDMDQTAVYLCKNIMGAKFAFIQSDEISILMTDFDELGTTSWFDSDVQKVCSVSASMATAKFNELRWKRGLQILEDPRQPDELWISFEKMKLAEFDSRVFQIPDPAEVFNYMLWRQRDTTRNSISTVAQSLYSDKELHKKNSDQKQEMIFQKGINWNDYAPRYKRGRMVVKEMYEKAPDEPNGKSKSTLRSRWVVVETPIFTQDKQFLASRIPINSPSQEESAQQEKALSV
jgi:tRNA(His) guanylyltransferase